MRPNMYSLILGFFLAFTLLSAPASANNLPGAGPEKELSAEDAARLASIKHRVEEIKAMDKSDLSKTERKALKKELKEMKKKARALSGGVYLSVGAIIIIILLLILIL
jgi:hypothetical protein